MREIKFRAWDKADGNMLLFDGIFNNRPFTERSTFPQYESFPEFHELAIMQFTGLKDKNGVEIYEGDIIHQTDINSDMPNAVIEWQPDGAWFGIKFKAGGAWNMQHAKMKVIGNIFENPDLLEDS